MPSHRPTSVALAFLALTWCGGPAPSQPPPVAPSPTPAAGSASSAPAATPDPPSSTAHLPGTCADPSAPVCTPPADFVERMCAKPTQDVALALFSKETPFTRLYLKGRLDELDFDEEVIALRFHGPQKGGMVV